MAYINGTRIMSAQLNGLVAIDEELSAVSTNPVQNKVVGNTLANAVKGTVTGIGVVRMDDVSPVEHELDVKVTSKNLLDSGQVQVTNTNTLITGDVLTTNFADSQIYVQTYNVFEPGTYTFTVFPVSGELSCSLYVYNALDKNEMFNKYEHCTDGSPITRTFTSGAPFYVAVGGFYPRGEYAYKLQLEKGAITTPYTPYISSMADLDGVLVTRRGKNLFNKNDTDCLLNGYISGAGTYMASSAGEKSFIFKCAPNTDYVISKLYNLTSRVAGFSTPPSNGTTGTYIGEYNGKTSYTFNSGTAEYIVVWYLNNSREAYTNEEMLDSIQLETGTTATPYTPYVEPTYHLAGMDGTVDGVLSASPMTTLTADTDSVVVTATYNKDTNAVINTLAERLAALEATTSI